MTLAASTVQLNTVYLSNTSVRMATKVVKVTKGMIEFILCKLCNNKEHILYSSKISKVVYPHLVRWLR